MRAVSGPVRPIVEAFQSVALIAPKPAVQGLSMDAPIPSHLGHRPTFRDYHQDRFVPLLSHAHLPHPRECQASAGTPVRHQPQPRQA
jgi:hypothetical protein